MIHAKFEFKMMAKETKHKEELAKVRAQYLRERDHVMIHVLHNFDELRHFGWRDINVSDFELAVAEVGKNYLSLKQAVKI